MAKILMAKSQGFHLEQIPTWWLIPSGCTLPPDPGMSASTAGSGLGDEAVRLMAEEGPGESLSPKKVLIWVWINTY